ncbi:hypothetical protein HY626_03025 [Candidatus Uhrbacteria bacterium]|nr:hypothetical protein [Candidatus Uhrbacteria bacterium]
MTSCEFQTGICRIDLPERHLESLVSAALQMASDLRVLPRLLGEVIAVPERSFGFIGRATTLIGAPFDTSGDVFIHQDECAVPLAVGLAVEFTLINDPRREGRFRALNGCSVASLPVLAEEVAQLPTLASRQPYHVRAKVVEAVEVRKAFANAPFGGVIGTQVGETVEIENDTELSAFVQTYLEEVFPGLQGQGVSFTLGTNRSEEAARITSRNQRLRGLSMIAQANTLQVEYDRFLVTMDALLTLRDAGYLVPGVRMSTKILNMLVGNPERLRSRRSSAADTAAFQRANSEFATTIRFLKEHELLAPGTAIPIEHTADLFMAAPVWYVRSHVDQPNTWDDSDPRPDQAVRDFAGLFGTQEWAHLFQMFNRRTRPFSRYEGDMIPDHIVTIIERVGTFFDYLVIATPYHDVAGREWEDPAWRTLIDPYLVGFKKGVPYLFFLGRWSDTGVFPLVGEMIADTIGYLKVNKAKLAGFGSLPFWHFSDPSHPDRQGHSNSFKDAGSRLQTFVDELIRHFEAGTLFPFLRGSSDRALTVIK